jgi:leucyl aminopeptidase
MPMLIKPLEGSPLETQADALVVGVYSQQPTSGAAAAADAALGGAIGRLIESGDFKGKLGETATFWPAASVRPRQIVLVGLGEREKFKRGEAFRASAAASLLVAGKKRERVVFALGEDWPAAETESGIAGAIVGCQGQDLYRAERKRHPFQEIAWAVSEVAFTTGALDAGRVLGESINLTRKLVDQPPSEIYPESFAKQAQAAAAELGLAVEVWDERKLAAEKCGSLLAVAQGSTRPARLVIWRYNGGKKDQAPLALVGKGVTFDSGGLSIKPSDGMKTMKCDMAGAATVQGAMQSIARLKLPLNVVGFAGLVENMLGGEAFKLGDVLTARSGKTIEVLNTDAEGRLVLADVLNVALDSKPSHIIDLATLTGACVVALGTDVAGLMTNDQSWCDTISHAAAACGEQVWQLPMFPEFAEQIKSDVADIKNIGNGRWGGAITAAKFLEEFVGETPWTHIDIAGPAFLDSPKPHLDGGATGALVRTLVEVARNLARPA